MIRFTSSPDKSFKKDYAVEMQVTDDLHINELMEFFSCFAKAMGYAPESVYKACEEYLAQHEFEINRNEGDVA